MASASGYALSPVAANTCSSSSFCFNNHSSFSLTFRRFDATSKFKLRASSDEPDDCNVEECAPDKEVGKVSVEWLAGEKTKVVGTFPPKKKGWTGYVEKDTAGQTNIYSVEPTVYVAESAISSGTAGTSSDGSENTLAIAGGLALIAVASASSILLQVDKNPPQIKTAKYSGPSLSYYISKFKQPEIVPASAPAPSVVDSLATESQNPAPEIAQVPVETENKVQELSSSTADNAS